MGKKRLTRDFDEQLGDFLGDRSKPGGHAARQNCDR
jgi:hypothetical protein